MSDKDERLDRTDQPDQQNHRLDRTRQSADQRDQQLDRMRQTIDQRDRQIIRIQRTIDRLTGAVLILGAIVDDEVNCPGNDRNSTVRETISDMVSDAWRTARTDCVNRDSGTAEPEKARPDESIPDRSEPGKTEPDETGPSNVIYAKGGYVDPDVMLRALGIRANDWPTVTLDRDQHNGDGTNRNTKPDQRNQDQNEEVD